MASFPAPLTRYLVHGEFETYLDETQANFLVNHCWLQDLLRTHAESSWPDMLNTPLLNAAKQCHATSFMKCEPYQTSVVFYPAVAAAVAAGIMRIEDYVRLDPNAIYEMKKIREFDRDWFGAAYSYFVSVYAKMNKENEA